MSSDGVGISPAKKIVANNYNLRNSYNTPKTSGIYNMCQEYNEYSLFNSSSPKAHKFNKTGEMKYSSKSPNIKPRRQIQNLLSSAPRVGRGQTLKYGSKTCKSKSGYSLSINKTSEEIQVHKNKILLKLCEI